jgi:hypothetical protein
MATGFTQERIAAALDGFRRFLSGERRAPLLSVYTPPGYRQNPDPEVMVAGACAAIRADAASGERHILPTFWPDFGTVSTAALWGGERIPAADGGGPHIRPVARALRDLERLPAPVAFEESDFFKALTLYRQVCARLESNEIFIRTPDFQGPLNTLGLLIDQTELICGLYEAPDLVAAALARITETLIAYVRRFRESVGAAKVVGNIWPYVALPDGQGVGVTQDYMPLLSPELYARFELPLLKRIADAFGGVWIHCCGEFRQHLPALRAADIKIWGIEMHHPCTPMEEVWRALDGRVAYTPYLSLTGVREYVSLADYYRHLAHSDCAQARFWFCLCSDSRELDELRRLLPEFGRVAE